MNQLRIALTTCPTIEVAQDIAKKLVEERLAACSNIVPGLTSVYRWEGSLNVDPEVLLIIKTSPERVQALELRLKELHPYKVPEFVVLEPAQVSEAYGAWVSESVR